MPTFAQSFFSRRTALRLVVVGVLLFALLIAVRTFENWRGERAWAKYRAAAEQRGVRLSLMDFVPPAVPDAENFAAIPIIQEIFAASDARQPIPEPFARPDASQGKDSQFKDPPLANRFKGARFDAVQWRDALHKMGLLAPPTDNPARDVLTALNHYERVFQQLHEAALRPHARFPVHWEQSITAQHPHYGFMQAAAHHEALRMNAHLLLGESAAAYADWRDGLALYRALEHEPTLIAGLIRINILSRLETAVWDGLAGRQWAEPELQALAADFASLNLLADLRFALASERGVVNDWMIALPARERAGFFFAAVTKSMQIDPSGDVLGWLYPEGWFRLSQLELNEVFDHYLAPLDVEHGTFAGDASASIVSSLESKGLIARIPYYFAAVLTPALDGAVKRFLSEHTAVQQIRTALALELFRRVHGIFPERLEELVPTFLDALPRDVMDGAPMRYRRDGENFKLWSIALDRKDDAGEPGPAPKFVDQLDWVWHY